MNMDDIIEKYEENWVYLINCKKGEYGGTLGGEVVLTAKTLNELFDGMKKYKNEESETVFFGIPSKDTMFLL
jgi:hypothetical protein